MASVYKKGGRWWVRFKGADGRWQGAPAAGSPEGRHRTARLDHHRAPLKRCRRHQRGRRRHCSDSWAVAAVPRRGDQAVALEVGLPCSRRNAASARHEPQGRPAARSRSRWHCRRLRAPLPQAWLRARRARQRRLQPPLPEGQSRPLDPAAAEEGHRLPLAPPHDRHPARAREGASVRRAEDPPPREHRDDARHLHASRRHRGHARRSRQARLRSARRARPGTRRPAPKKRDLCYQFATGSRFPKRRGP